MGESHASWASVPYSPGRIEAHGYYGNETEPGAKMTVVTTGGATQIIASIKDGVGANGIVADNSDVALVQVEVQDEDGNVVPANGDPSSLTNDKSPTREAYHGLALGIVQGTHEEGSITVTATTKDLGSSTVTIRSKPPTVQVLRLQETLEVEV